jgi:hypothetical protein
MRPAFLDIHGIETAIVAHFSTDIIYHVGGTAMLRAFGKL